MFADKVEIEVRAGAGGDGRVSFRHEKIRARGGPDGGDGGRGGNVVVRVDHNLNTLAAFRRQALVAAGAGQPGGGDRRHGKNGTDVVLPVPEGTQVLEGDRLIADLVHDGQEMVVAAGGRGGFGNAHFTSSVRQAPRAAELGERGETKQLSLELKLVADVGLVGLPNAGKSTLLSVISNAKPEIGDYPFTTLIPNLGVVDFEGATFLVADIPGLIEGASTGKGLGDEFLRHIERTAVLLHLIDAYSDNLTADYRLIREELRAYSPPILKKPQIVVLTKTEGMSAADVKKLVATLKFGRDKPTAVLAISAAAHEHIDALLRQVLPLVQAARTERAAVAAEAAVPVIDETTQPDTWRLQKDGESYLLTGTKLESFARRTDWSNDDSVERLRDILRKSGVGKELKRQGAPEAAPIHIDGHDLILF